MRNIGMIVAVEIDAALNEFGVPIQELKFVGYSVYLYKLGEYNLFVIHSGAGEIAAAMTTQFLISEFNVDLIVNFGVVGGLTREMEAAGIVLTCNKNKIPCLLIKTVSDSITGGVNEFKSAINESERICVKVMNRILNSI